MADNATPGPWRAAACDVFGPPFGPYPVLPTFVAATNRVEDAAFIVALANASRGLPDAPARAK